MLSSSHIFILLWAVVGPAFDLIDWIVSVNRDLYSTFFTLKYFNGIKGNRQGRHRLEEM